MRKIDDELLLNLLKVGKSQKACSEHFHVSEAAISKRVKRLCPPPSLERLTDRERRFAIEVANGASATQAALKTCDVTSRESAKVTGNNLLKKPDVRLGINELMDHFGMSRSYRINKLKDFVENADPSIGVRSLDMAFKLANDYPANKNIINLERGSLIEFNLDLVSNKNQDVELKK